MKAYILEAGASDLSALKLVERDTPQPAADEVLIRVRACSLNYRDQAIVKGQYMGGALQAPITPLSDGAGEVTAVGSAVTKFRVGDRVQGLFFQNWQDGPPNPGAGPALGAAGAKGMLAEYVTLPEHGVTRMAESLSFEEAACLPCAGVTAWNALMEGARPTATGDTVLILGSGGVSLLAMQIAKAAGATVLATSGSDPKLDRLKREFGVAGGVNYKAEEKWGAKAAELAGPEGIAHVVEVGGIGTLQQSMEAVGFAGEVALIGVLTQGPGVFPHALMLKGASLRGIFVGSGAMADKLNAFVDQHGIKPVIGRTFGFDEARAAYDYAASPELFGKAVIRVA